MLSDSATASAYTVPIVQKEAGWDYIDPVIGTNYHIQDSSGNTISPTAGAILKVSVDEAISITFATKEEAEADQDNHN